MIDNIVFLIPPSKEKIIGGDETKPYRLVQNLKKYNFFQNLSTEREFVYALLREVIANNSEENLMKLFKIKSHEKLLEILEINSDLLNRPTMKSIERYNGVFYKNLNYKDLDDDFKKILELNTFILNPLFGIVRGIDFIPNYYLDFENKLNNINLYDYWNQNLLGVFNYLFKDKIVINLLPESYDLLFRNFSFNNSLFYFNIKFIENGKNVGHNSKVLKALFLREFLKNVNENGFNKNIFKSLKIRDFNFKEILNDGEVVYEK
jgi:hypothetical protein